MSIELSGLLSVWVAAVGLLAAARTIRTSSNSVEVMPDLLQFIGLVLLAVGLLGVCFELLNFGGFIAWLLILGIWARVAWHYRMIQRRGLLSALAVAARRDLPLPAMALAFAQEEQGTFGRRVRRFASRLGGGSSLCEAIRGSSGVLPREAMLAASIGELSGDLAGSLDAVTFRSVFDPAQLRPFLIRFLYIVPVILLFVAFMKVKIEPSYFKIMSDFNVAPFSGRASAIDALSYDSSMSPAVRAIPQIVMTHWRLGSMAVAVYNLLLVLFIVAALYAWLQWRGTLKARLPVWKRIINWVDAAGVLRILALTTRLECPLHKTVNTASQFHPKHTMRRRLRNVARELDNGEPWQASLAQQGLLTSNDAAVVTAAQANGNLAWALDEMAASFERRANFRLQALGQAVMPLLLIPVGLLVAMLCIAYFVPLIELVEVLSR